MHIKIYSCLLSVILAIGSLQAQNQESFTLHTNKNFYVTGEIIWYTLLLPPAIHDTPTVVNCLVVAPDGNIRDRFFLKSEGTPTIKGHFAIPYEYRSGLYRLVFQSALSDFEPDVTLLQAKLPIYSDLSKDLPAPNNAEIGPLTNEGIENELDITINMPSNLVVGREASCNIMVKDQNGQPAAVALSIAINDATLNALSADDVPAIFQGEAIATDALSNIAQTAYFKGIAMDHEGQPTQLNIMGAYAGKTDKMYYAKTDKEGRFNLKMEPFYDEQSVQFVGYKNELNLKFKPASTSNFPPVEGTLPVNDFVYEYLKWSQMRKKINQHFGQPSPLSLEMGEEQINEYKPDFSFDTKEYVKFEKVVDFFSELLTPLRFKKEDSLYIATMYNPAARQSRNDQLSGNPIFIIDGKVTKDAHFIANLELSNIETIDLFFKPLSNREQFNVLGMKGVAKMSTFIPQFELPAEDKEDVFLAAGFQPEGSFKRTLPRKETGDKIPNFTSTTEWKNQLATNARGETSFTFTPTADRGEFVIQVVAFSNNGVLGYQTVTYTIE